MEIEEYTSRASMAAIVAACAAAIYITGLITVFIQSKDVSLKDYYTWPYLKAWKLKGKVGWLVKLSAVLSHVLLLAAILMLITAQSSDLNL